LESLHISLQRNESKQNFNIWVYGEKDNLKRGSGLFVPQEGVIFDHHFVLPEDGANFNFQAGTYILTVIAKLVGESFTHDLASIDLSITESQASKLVEQNTGIFFDWGPDQQNYHSHIKQNLTSEPDFEELLEIMVNKKMQPTQKVRDVRFSPWGWNWSYPFWLLHYLSGFLSVTKDIITYRD
jgi:hypothetical protein